MTHGHPQPPVDCPVCGFALSVSGLVCEACGTELRGRFTPCPWCSLTDEETKLVGTLLATGGDREEAARRHGLDTDTLRVRLQAVAARFGPEPDRPQARRPIVSAPTDRSADGDFLQRLARGVVEADEALRHLP